SVFWPVIVSGYNQTTHGDLDADGDDDLVVGSGQGSDFVYVYRNVGDGMPQSIRFLQAPCGGGSVQGVAVGDYNGDGMGDVAVVSGGNLPNTCVVIHHGLGGFQFAAPLALATYEVPGTTRTADLNADGRDDLVVLHDGGRRVGIYLQGDTELGDEQLYELPFANHAGSEALALGDINSDGCLDVAIANDAGLVTLLGEGCEPLFSDGFETATR
ncbi:MAG: VCBS repeat-containing protein, partial [Xanthomonadales bacterium]|nr:VCBS repeat-containing protein [Xanthomonadales bacterium]